MTDKTSRAKTGAAPAGDTGGGATPAFVHLKVHSAYSLLEGALPIPGIAKLAVGYGYPAVALTDTNNLFGALEFSQKVSAAGVQPIVGVSLALKFRTAPEQEPHNGASKLAGASAPKGPEDDGAIALYAMNEAGYANLMKLVSQAHLETTDTDVPHITVQQLAHHNDGLIILTGGPDGPIDRALTDGQSAQAMEWLDLLQQVFHDRLYVELQRHGDQGQRATEAQLIDAAYDKGLPLVATNEAYFATPDDYEAHDALICIAAGRYVVEDDRRRLTPSHYFKSPDEMTKTFADLPEALANTVEIAKRCAFRPVGRDPILPRFVKAKRGASAADELEAEAAEFQRQAEDGLKVRLKENPLAPGFSLADYEERLAYEIGIIKGMKFPGYFLIVADFIKWSKGKGIPVGPGRGSGAGSLVAWALTITDLDPLRFGLLFERFLNPERVSMPDFDIDFCQDRREETIRYVQEKYGRDRVAQIITHGKLQARAVLRDVGRVLQMPYGQVDKLCKLVPNNPAQPVTLRDAIDGEPKLQEARDEEPIVAQLLDMSLKLEGLYRHASTHAAGLVIGDRPLDELVPLYRDPKSDMPVTQFNWKLVEAAGLVKFDFLGLKTLTVLQKAVELVKRVRGIDVDLAGVPLDDGPSFELLAKADTIGVFQLESTGMRESLKRLKPDRFEDIIAMVALYRPGPMDNIPTFINRKHGEEPVDYLHDMLESILSETYGVIIYQEQVIQIAQVMGGYSLGQADMLRRAMGKKDKLEMARQQARFVEGAVERKVSQKDAAYIFELVDKFAGYGFNKSHAAAYALVSYHTAYMKANYREEFLAASMTLDMSNTDKLAMFAAEARRSGIEVLPPCVNASEVDFMAIAGKGEGERGAIRYSLAALKNIGTGAVETIVASRNENGAYTTLGDFASRMDTKALNKRGLETLAQSGAFDGLEKSRAVVHANTGAVMALAQRTESDAAAGTSDLFVMDNAAPELHLRDAKGWTPLERLEHEFSAIGFYLSGHPLDQYAKVLEKLGVQTYAAFEAATKHGVTGGRLAGIVIAARVRTSAKGNKFAFAMFSDATGQFEAVVFSETLEKAREILDAGTPVLVSVEAERDGDTVKMRALGIEALDEAVAGVQQGLRVKLEPLSQRAEKNPLRTVEAIKAALMLPQKGVSRGGEIRLVQPVPVRGQEVEYVVPGKFDCSPNAAGSLSALSGVAEVEEI